MKRMLSVLVVLALLIIWGCSSGVNTDSDPRRVVIKMFNAMENNEREDLAHFLDFAALLKSHGRDYALQMDSARAFRSAEEILDDMVDSGLTKIRWFGMQKVVGSSEIMGDTALVEVSFINKKTDTQYYNKFGLHRINDRWKIYSFSVRE